MKDKKQDKTLEHALNMAFKYLSYQPRTVFEVQEHIKKKGFDNDIAFRATDILHEKKYLNDKNYAELYIESKVKYKPKSRFAFRYELKKKGIDTHTIDSVLEHYDDQDLAILSVKTKLKAWRHLGGNKWRKKLMSHLKYKGFNYDTSISTLHHFEEYWDDTNH